MTKFCGQVNIPTVNNDPIACAQFFDTDCVIYQNPIAYFGTVDPSTSTEVFNFIISSLIDARTRLGTVEGTILPTTHADLLGLDGDDHTQYHTDARALTWLGTRSTSDLTEGTNEYFTEVKTLASTLTGINVLLTGDVVATDTVIEGFGKLQYQLDNIAVAGTTWGSITGTLSTQTDLQSEFNAKADLGGGSNTFTNFNYFNNYVGFRDTTFAGVTGVNMFGREGSDVMYISKEGSSSIATLLDVSLASQKRTHTFQNKDGTLAHLSDIVGTAEIYGISWDANIGIPTKNDIYDKIEAISLAAGVPYTGAVATLDLGAQAFITTGSLQSNSANFINVITRDTGGANRSWTTYNSIITDKLTFGYETGVDTESWTNLYAMNESGVPTDPIDLVTKDYGDSTYTQENTGTWTPLLTTSSGNDYTYIGNFSTYYRVGSMVVVSLGVNGITDGASTLGSFRVSGLPYATSGTMVNVATGTITTARGSDYDFYLTTPYISGSLIVFSINGTASTTNPQNVKWTGTQTQKALTVTLTYFTTDPV